MRYEFDSDLQRIAEEVSKLLFPHVIVERIKCFKSYGSSSKYTIARCHALGKVMQKALNTKAHYVIEFITENFDKLDNKEKLKVVIHELMHIPKTFGGGFKHHDFVCEKNVNLFYKKFEDLKNRRDDN
jgi:predicted metallopeptidase|tara:strand:- start:39 stop:422 length:384 start_codon:yes stop_codon:yes gene_type:complete